MMGASQWATYSRITFEAISGESVITRNGMILRSISVPKRERFFRLQLS